MRGEERSLPAQTFRPPSHWRRSKGGGGGEEGGGGAEEEEEEKKEEEEQRRRRSKSRRRRRSAAGGPPGCWPCMPVERLEAGGEEHECQCGACAPVRREKNFSACEKKYFLCKSGAAGWRGLGKVMREEKVLRARPRARES